MSLSKSGRRPASPDAKKKRVSALPPERSLGHVIREANRIFQRTLGEKIRPFGVSLGQWYVLRVLWQEDGLSQVEIANRAGIMTPTATMALKTMFNSGFAKQREDANDRRKKLIFLTQAGKDLEAKCLREAAEINRIALRKASKGDLETTLRVLLTAQSNLLAD